MNKISHLSIPGTILIQAHYQNTLWTKGQILLHISLPITKCYLLNQPKKEQQNGCVYKDMALYLQKKTKKNMALYLKNIKCTYYVLHLDQKESCYSHRDANKISLVCLLCILLMFYYFFKPLTWIVKFSNTSLRA